MGSTWKATQKDSKLLTKQTLISTIFGGPQIPQKSMYIDLDPHYSDVYGDPVPRVTMDYGNNELKLPNFCLRSTQIYSPKWAAQMLPPSRATEPRTTTWMITKHIQEAEPKWDQTLYVSFQQVVPMLGHAESFCSRRNFGNFWRQHYRWYSRCRNDGLLSG